MSNFHTLPIGPNEARMLKSSTDQLDIVLARAFGLHGSLWAIEDVTTGGDLGPPLSSSHGPYEMYIVTARDWSVALNSTDTLVPDAQWVYVAPWVIDEVTGNLTPIFLDEGNVLVSVQDGARFLVQTVYQDVHNTVGMCEMLESSPVSSEPQVFSARNEYGVGL